MSFVLHCSTETTNVPSVSCSEAPPVAIQALHALAQVDYMPISEQYPRSTLHQATGGSTSEELPILLPGKNCSPHAHKQLMISPFQRVHERRSSQSISSLMLQNLLTGHLTVTTLASVIHGLKAIFSRHGIPVVLMSDNGP